MKTKKVLFLLFVNLFIFASCKKEQGCMNSSADNYSNEAEEDDGSCTFSGRAYFAYSYDDQNNFEDDNIENLELFVDNEFIGFQKTDVAIVKLGCGGSSNVTKTFNWAGSSSATKLLKVVDQATGLTIYSREFTVYANNCTGVSIDY
ncbi:MAG: hypothetical protein AB8B74_10600 [Crocinitomicaceae bacterium]